MAKSAISRWANSIKINSNLQQADTTSPDGLGVTTPQLSNPNVAAIVAAPPGSGDLAPKAPWQQPVPVWLGLVGLMVLYKYVEEHPSSGVEKASLFRISIGNLLKVTIMAVIGLNFGKWVLTYWRVPGISTLFLAA